MASRLAGRPEFDLATAASHNCRPAPIGSRASTVNASDHRVSRTIRANGAAAYERDLGQGGRYLSRAPQRELTPPIASPPILTDYFPRASPSDLALLLPQPEQMWPSKTFAIVGGAWARAQQ